MTDDEFRARSRNRKDTAMANRHQRRAQAAASRRENVEPDLCVCCNARKVMQHFIEHGDTVLDGNNVPLTYQRDDTAIIDFGVLRIAANLNTTRFEICALSESVAWFDPAHFECERGIQPWVYSLWAIREQLDERFGPQDIGGHAVH